MDADLQILSICIQSFPYLGNASANDMKTLTGSKTKQIKHSGPRAPSNTENKSHAGSKIRWAELRAPETHGEGGATGLFFPVDPLFSWFHLFLIKGGELNQVHWVWIKKRLRSHKGSTKILLFLRDRKKAGNQRGGFFPSK